MKVTLAYYTNNKMLSRPVEGPKGRGLRREVSPTFSDFFSVEMMGACVQNGATVETSLKNFRLFRLYNMYMFYTYVLYTRRFIIFCRTVMGEGAYPPTFLL